MHEGFFLEASATVVTVNLSWWKYFPTVLREAISDGARWIWEYWNTFRPDAIQSLDYFHAVEKIDLWVSIVDRDENHKTERANNLMVAHRQKKIGIA